MSGWMPFAKTLNPAMTDDREDGDDKFDIAFGSDGEDVGRRHVILHESSTKDHDRYGS